MKSEFRAANVNHPHAALRMKRINSSFSGQSMCLSPSCCSCRRDAGKLVADSVISADGFQPTAGGFSPPAFEDLLDSILSVNGIFLLLVSVNFLPLLFVRSAEAAALLSPLAASSARKGLLLWADLSFLYTNFIPLLPFVRSVSRPLLSFPRAAPAKRGARELSASREMRQKRIFPSLAPQLSTRGVSTSCDMRQKLSCFRFVYILRRWRFLLLDWRTSWLLSTSRRVSIAIGALWTSYCPRSRRGIAPNSKPFSGLRRVGSLACAAGLRQRRRYRLARPMSLNVYSKP